MRALVDPLPRSGQAPLDGHSDDHAPAKGLEPLFMA